MTRADAPERVAMIDAATRQRITYSELDQRVARCVTVLEALVGRPLSGERVAVLGRNSVEQVLVALACEQLGAAFTPLNWRLATAELAALVADCEPRLLLHDAEFADAARAAAAGQSIAVAAFSDIAGSLAQATPAAPRRLDPDAVSTLLYTSGTTGRPKGVIITTAGARHAALNMAAAGELDADAVMLCDAPLFHTVGLFGVTRTALTAGATVIISDRFAPGLTLTRLSDAEFGVTHYFCVPQMAAMLREDAGWAGADLSRLKAIFVGGAPIGAELIEAYLGDGVLLVNGFGATETGTVMHMPLEREAIRRSPGCVGAPRAGVEVRIAGSDGRSVSPGDAGELQVRGPAVTPGYWRQPEASAAAFVDGWFRTGDIAREEPEGVFRLLDRAKDMYISGGENVYPAEVEAALLAHPQVLEAAVIGAPHARWGECGVAFVVVRSPAAVEAQDLLAHCGARLGRYKLPAEIHFVDALARTPSGKLRKDVLRGLYAASSTPTTREPQDA